MADWLFIYRATFDLYVSNAAIRIPIAFTASRLIVQAIATPINNPGTLRQVPFVAGFGEVQGTAQALRTGLQSLTFSAEYPYRLVFEPNRRLDTLQLAIWINTMPIHSDETTPSSNTGTTTNVAAVISSTVLIAANTSRKALTIHNESISVLYIGFGATVSTNNFSVKIPANSLWEMPTDYDGAIVGIWTLASGKALITEFV